MADKPYEPDIIGDGAARDAARKLKERKNRVDSAVDGATGTPPPPAPTKQPDEKMSTELMRRISRMLRMEK